MGMLCFLSLVFAGEKARAGGCFSGETEEYKACIQDPFQCDKLKVCFEDQLPKWSDSFPPDKRFLFCNFTYALSCYPIDQTNLASGLYELSRKAEMLGRIRDDSETRAFLKKFLVPMAERYPVLLKDETVRYYLLGLRHPLTKKIDPLTLYEQVVRGDASVVGELERSIQKNRNKCDPLSLLFLAKPAEAIQVAQKEKLNCYNTPQETVALLKRVFSRVKDWGYAKR